jgi:eukaryotic-like serine/threonine-protein kinase
LQFSPDPRVRSYLVNWLGPLGCDAQSILTRLDREPDITIRRALFLILGHYSETELTPATRESLTPKVLAIFEKEPDAGVHAAAQWLLRRWGQAKQFDAIVERLKCDEKQLQSRKATEKRQWYINSQKQTYVIVDARQGKFLMGSPKSEAERFSGEIQHARDIGRRFAIAACEVTKEQFARCQQDLPWQTNKTDELKTDDWVKTSDSPQVQITWWVAATYCNWLSEKEGIPKDQWCYEPNSKGEFNPGMKAKDKFWELTGYRLPTESEWEYACRAGTVTSRFYGTSDSLLPKYAWYQDNAQGRTWPTASLQPNDFGLFDMLGNAFEWCYDRPDNYAQLAGKITEDHPSTDPLKTADRRVMRGGGWIYKPPYLRSANRLTNAPDAMANAISFRPVRSYP